MDVNKHDVVVAAAPEDGLRVPSAFTPATPDAQGLAELPDDLVRQLRGAGGTHVAVVSDATGFKPNMNQQADGPADHANEVLRALDGPAGEDLEHSGPGLDRPEELDERMLSGSSLPGGLDHTAAAAGAGGLGLALLGIAGIFKRRQNRRHELSPDE